MNYAKSMVVPVRYGKINFPPFCSNCLAPNPDRKFTASKASSWSGFDVEVNSPTFGARKTTYRQTNLEIPICSTCYKKCRGTFGFRAKWPVRVDAAFPIGIAGRPATLYVELSFVNIEYAQKLQQANPGAY